MKLLPDILAINETWGKKSSIGQFKNLKHYKYVSNFRKHLRGGGVALYIKEGIKYAPRYDLTYMDEGNFESLFIDIQLGNEKITCGTIYRLPKQDKSSNERFRLKLRGELNAIKASKNNAYIMGDFNYDLLHQSHAFTDGFVDTMYDYSFYSIINKPTRITQNLSSCLDHIWKNIHDKIIKNAIITHKIADHLPVIQSTEISTHKSIIPAVRNFSQNNISSFNKALSEINSTETINSTNADNVMEFLIQKYSYLFNKHFPFLEKQSKNLSNSWFTNDLNKLLRKKDRLYKNYIKNKSLANKKKYNGARNLYFRQVSIEKKNFYPNLFDKHKNNIKKQGLILMYYLEKNWTITL